MTTTLSPSRYARNGVHKRIQLTDPRFPDCLMRFDLATNAIEYWQSYAHEYREAARLTDESAVRLAKAILARAEQEATR